MVCERCGVNKVVWERKPCPGDNNPGHHDGAIHGRSEGVNGFTRYRVCGPCYRVVCDEWAKARA